MSKALEELRELFNQSSLPIEDQNDLLVFLPILPESVLKQLSAVFKENPDLIEEFHANFKAKFNALAGTGDKTWDEIIKKEAEKSGEIPEDEEELKDEVESLEDDDNLY